MYLSTKFILSFLGHWIGINQPSAPKVPQGNTK